jgi:PAS domain S-box-containing protein
MTKTPWDKLEPDDMAHELLGRNSKFQMMISFLGMIPVPAAIKDRKGRVIYLNRKAEDLWGIKLRSAQGKQMSEIMQLSGAEAHALKAAERTVLAGQDAMTFYETSNPGPSERRMCVLRFPLRLDEDVLIVALYITLSAHEGVPPK